MPRFGLGTGVLRHPRAFDIAVAATAFAVAGLLPLMLQQRPKYAVVAVFGLATVVAALTIRTSLVSLLFGWLLIAPLLQEPATTSNIGHLLQYALYELPPLLFLAWTWWLRGSRQNVIRAAAPDLLPLLLFLFAAASVFLSTTPDSDTFNRLHDVVWNIGLGVAVYYVLAFAPLSRAALESITLGVLATTSFAALVAIAQYVGHFSLWSPAPRLGLHPSSVTGTLNNQGVASAIGTLGNPAVLGTVAGVGTVFAVSLLAWGGPVRWRNLAWLSLPLTLGAVALSFERAPMIATALLVLAVVASRRRLRLPTLAVVAVLSATAVVVIPHLVTAPVYQKRATNAAGLRVRLQVAQRALQLGRLSPLLGHGYDTYETVSREQTLATSTADIAGARGVTSHNTLITMFVEVGLVGVALLLTHWIWVVAGAVRRLRRRLIPPWLAAAWLSGVAVVSINAMAIDLRFFSFVCVIPWACLGLLRRFHPVR